VFVSGWSVVNMAHALARSALQLSVVRFFLGVTEAANIPAGVKAVSEWFPVKERALAVGHLQRGDRGRRGAGGAGGLVGGARLGLAGGVRGDGRRGARVVVALRGLYQVPGQAPAARSRGARAHRGRSRAARDARVARAAAADARDVGLRRAARCSPTRSRTSSTSGSRSTCKASTGSPRDVRRWLWIPFVALALGNVAAGAIPRALMARGVSLDRARKGTILAVSLVMPVLCYVVTRAPTAPLAVALISAIMFGHAAWGNVILPAEVFPKRVVGTVSGLGRRARRGGGDAHAAADRSASCRRLASVRCSR
jgi:ACS family hexuronate transporter-like MFS transporter